MIYDIWYMIYDIWYMIYDIWYMIYDLIWYVLISIYMQQYIEKRILAVHFWGFEGLSVFNLCSDTGPQSFTCRMQDADPRPASSSWFLSDLRMLWKTSCELS